MVKTKRPSEQKSSFGKCHKILIFYPEDVDSASSGFSGNIITLIAFFLILSSYNEMSGNSMLLFSKEMSSNHKIWIWMPNSARSSGQFGPTRLAQASVECFPRIFWRPIQGFQRGERHVQHGTVTKKHRLEFPGFCEIKIVSLISLRKLALYNFHFVLKKHEKLKIEWEWKN